jgi:hypothetical protein
LNRQAHALPDFAHEVVFALEPVAQVGHIGQQSDDLMRKDGLVRKVTVRNSTFRA